MNEGFGVGRHCPNEPLVGWEATLRRSQTSAAGRKGRILAYRAGPSPPPYSPKTQRPKPPRLSMHRWLHFLVYCFVGTAPALLALPVATAAPVRTAHVEAELVPEQSALTPGRPLTIALRLTMERGWHTPWQNPGASGLPTTLACILPGLLALAAIPCPAASPLCVCPLFKFAYRA